MAKNIIEISAFQAVSNKMCGSCVFWAGERILNRGHNTFEVNGSEFAPCIENPSHGFKQLGNQSGCERWELAGGLKLPTPPKKETSSYETSRKEESHRSHPRESSYSSGGYRLKADEKPERFFKGEGFAAIYNGAEIIEGIFVVGVKILSYFVHFFCYLGKVKVPDTVDSLMAKIQNVLNELKDYQNRGVILSDEEYEAKVNEIEKYKVAIENTSIDYDPYYEIARKIVVGFILLIGSVYGLIWYSSL